MVTEKVQIEEGAGFLKSKGLTGTVAWRAEQLFLP
jgi:hypothetical protein